jgi:16S rRNA (cytosine1402-N4)-methyltransferase
MEFSHISVLLSETIDSLGIKEDGIYVDCTVGGAGHSSEILKRIKSNGHLYGFDQDAVAIETARARLSKISPQFTLIHTNFRNMKQELKARGIRKVDGILFDLGVSSYQFDNGDRGFSYNHDAVLDMRMDKRQEFNAYTLVNTWSEKDIVDILFKYGEEKFAKQIAKKIIDFRKEKPLTTTFELVDVIKSAIPASKRKDGGHPAKRTFQALIVAVNDELNVLRNALGDALDLLNTNGRVCVITFQSLEDRIVKEKFKEASSGPTWKRGMPITLEEAKAEFKLITKHPIIASENELENNNRSHSAKLRIIEKI